MKAYVENMYVLHYSKTDLLPKLLNYNTKRFIERTHTLEFTVSITPARTLAGIIKQIRTLSLTAVTKIAEVT